MTHRGFAMSMVVGNHHLIRDSFGKESLYDLDADPALQVLVWADSPATVAATAAGLGAGRPATVLVELGAPGRRTGARDLATALAVAEAIDASPVLELGGVAGYEGAIAHGTTVDDLAAVGAYLQELAELHRAIGRAVSGNPVTGS